MKIKSVAISVAVSVLTLASAANAAELVVNGGFEQGNTGFSTTYTGSDQTGTIYITTNPSQITNRFLALQDHTSGTGYMLAFDGAMSGNPIWQETVNVVAGQNYTFSFWGHTLAVDNGQAEPNISASVNGVAIGALLFPDNMATTPNSWSHFMMTVNSGASTTLTLALSDLRTNHVYNDGALDDISFVGPAPAVSGAVPEPATWAMMIAGFGAVGFAMRRRARAATRFSYVG